MLFLAPLAQLYPPLVGVVGLGVILGHRLPPHFPENTGKFLYYLGIPISIVAFLQQANLSGAVWLAPIVAWAAILLGWGIAWWGIKDRGWDRATQGSFLLSAMVGNTGYIGYPVALAVGGEANFAWALFYDLLGTLTGSFGLGVILAARLGKGATLKWWLELIKNPALWSLAIGLGLRTIGLPPALNQALRGFGWSMIGVSLLLIGMRLSQLTSWKSAHRAAWSIAIKMLVVPLLLGVALPYLGIVGAAKQILIVQMAMPPAFATMVIAEVYQLDRELTVTALAMGSILLLFTLPIWIGL